MCSPTFTPRGKSSSLLVKKLTCEKLSQKKSDNGRIFPKHKSAYLPSADGNLQYTDTHQDSDITQDFDRLPGSNFM
jgi:hypothetical protein